MNEYISKKISIMSLVSIIGVLIIHCYYKQAEQFYIASFIQKLIGGQLVRFCVPMFFLISGYLFFNMNSGSFKTVCEKLKRRARTILAPYILWNFLFFISIIILNLFPITSPYVNTNFLKIIQTNCISKIILFLYWEPAAFHLWFLKYLVLFMLSTPIVFLVLHNKYFALASVFIVYFLFGILYCADSYVHNYFFFFLGAYISVRRINIARSLPFMLILISILGYFLWSFLNVIYPSIDTPQSNLLRLILGCFAIWGSYDYIFRRNNNTIQHLLKLSSYTFFVYLFHEPWINIFKKIALMILGVNTTSLIIAYVSIPIFMYFTCILIAFILQKILPRIYTILTGGRS